MQGNTQVNTGGQLSTTRVEGSFPACTVSVFNTGTLNLTTIYGDNLNPPTLKANPFTAGADGSGFFYAANGSRVDIQLSGTGITTPFVLAGDVLLDDPSLLAVLAPQTVAFNATPTFDLSQASWFKMILTGNVAGPVFSNPVAGSILILSLAQNAAGGWTFAFPVAFIDPPAIALGVNARTEMIFKYDGANWTAVAATGDNLQVPASAAIIGALTVGGALVVTGAITAGSFTNNLSAFAATTSAQLAGILTDEQGTGRVVFDTSPSLTTPNLTAPVIQGIITTYNAFTLVGNGIPVIAQTVDLTAQTANIGSTQLISLGPGGAGMYRVSVYAIVTSVGTTSTLPAVNVIFTDRNNSVSQTIAITATNSGNATTTLAQGQAFISAKASTVISYSTTGYASTGAAMQYALHIKLEPML